MHRLYQIFFQFKEYFIFALLVVLSITLMALNDNAQVRRIRSLTVGTVGFIQQTFSFIPNLISLQSENEALRKLNVNLSDEVSQLREAKLENLRLHSLLALRETTQAKLTTSKVVAKNLNLLRNTITLNSGEHDGVQIGNPIITGEGVVGRVVAVSGNYSIGQMMLNVDFRVSAKVQRSRVDGIVAWDGKTLLMKHVVKSMDVKVGDAIITSEYSNAFPPQLKIGIVSNVSEMPGSLFKKIEITPMVDFVRLEEVFVMDYVPSIEKMALEGKVNGK